MRITGAMYSNIDDCDEGTTFMSKKMCNGMLTNSLTTVFNFWEPLHFLDRGYGFQTWEVSPEYSIRSWAYIVFHLLPAQIPKFLLGVEKVGHTNALFDCC